MNNFYKEVTMAGTYSFDIVSKPDLQEIDNAVNQTIKEISQRYDFKGVVAEVEFNGKDEIKIHAQDEFKLKSILEILKAKMVKRGVSPKFLDEGKIEAATGGTVRETVKIKNGIEKEKAKEIVQEIKNTKLKVQAQIMDDIIRVSGKSKDDLQSVIQMLRGRDFGIELQFTNYR
jgi:uncharacterized protein YajQ (UPF0234 family)